ncbi:Spermidine/putrescine import ATP-binding protein PotA [Vibrio aerogenes CECT 7868]|uniref:Spermidine/putrescine import ATP-binding protein PotA n=1 Tax=Vibrio aerogenes CECT 7868 TaxID=1216006 RepID=A0A1M5ZMN8_9VIBR|nr:ABC transporter ATP-binding protein [Vibrio aerogenes]SHI25635.1 Spermidine/putrescine import ATP-binding protein PotA [Vibrio aerogenes CECT 7868]
MKLSDSSVSIHLKQIQKTFADGTLALKPLDLEIHAGEILVLLGPSGCGKTTTLRLIAGLEFADPGGHISFGSQDVTALPIEKRNVGMVFQSYALFPNMNVAENIGYGLRVRGEKPAQRKQKVDEMLTMFDLQACAHRPVDQLSGGQRQRVALARAIITRPQVLLLDEPLSALDAQLKKRLRGEIHLLLKSLGITAVYVTHDQEEAMEMGDRIVVLEQGQIAQTGTAEAIYLNPESRFVADFIGRMNYLHVHIKAGSSHPPVLRLPGGSVWELPECRLPDAWPQAGEVTLMIRPEDIRLATETADNTAIPATVVSDVFLGDRTRVIVDIGGGHPHICIDCFSRRIYGPGQTVFIIPDASRLIWLNAEKE